MAGLPPDSPRSSFDHLYGLKVDELDDGVVRGHVVVRDELKQPAGLVHGGVYAAMAEGLASVGTYVAVHDAGNVAMGMSNNTTFLRPVTQGTVHAVARARHRGRTTWVWDVELTDDDHRPIAVSRVTIAVRPQRG
jgi:1,4-dihydroxy-2-naphthoyl-CoA hydrolase